MSRKFYDLEYADGRHFSPYCWRTRFALAHKGLEAETVRTPSAIVVPSRMTNEAIFTVSLLPGIS